MPADYLIYQKTLYIQDAHKQRDVLLYEQAYVFLNVHISWNSIDIADSHIHAYVVTFFSFLLHHHLLVVAVVVVDVVVVVMIDDGDDDDGVVVVDEGNNKRVLLVLMGVWSMDRWSDNKVPQLGYTILIVPADGIMYFDMGAYFKCRN